jgi:hypothetical protein
VRRLFFEPTRGLGWAAGDNGTLLRSSDGGATWARQVRGGTAERARGSFLCYRALPVPVNPDCSILLLHTPARGATTGASPQLSIHLTCPFLFLRQATCTGSTLTDVVVDLDSRRGFATSAAGTNCWSSDAGASWGDAVTSMEYSGLYGELPG